MDVKRAACGTLLLALVALALPAPASARLADPTGVTVLPRFADQVTAVGVTLEGDVVRGVFSETESATTTVDGQGTWSTEPLRTLRAGTSSAQDVGAERGTATWVLAWGGESGGTREVAGSPVVLSRDGSLVAVSREDGWHVQRTDDATDLDVAPLGTLALDGRTAWTWGRGTSTLTGIDVDHPDAAPRVVDTGVTNPSTCATTMTVWGRWALLQCESTSTLVDLTGARPSWRVPTQRRGASAPQLGAGFVAFPRAIGARDVEYASLYVVRADDHDMVELHDAAMTYGSDVFGVDTAAGPPSTSGPVVARVAYRDASDSRVKVAEVDLRDPATDQLDEAPPVVSEVKVPATSPANKDVTLGFRLSDVGSGVGGPSGVYDATIVVHQSKDRYWSQRGFDYLQPVDGVVQVSVPPEVAAGGQVCAAVRSRDRFGNQSELSTEHCTTLVPPVGALTTTSLVATSPQGAVASLSATVSTSGAGTPTGRVDFYDYSTLVGSVPLVAGVASLGLTGVPMDRHGYRAQYVPDTTAFESSSDFVELWVAHATTTTASVSGATAYGSARQATFSTTMPDGSPIHDGILALTLDGRSLGTYAGLIGLALPRTLAPGVHTLTASYTGPSQYGPSAATTTFTVTRAASTLSESFPAVVARRKRASGGIVASRVPTSAEVPSGTVVVKKGATVIGRGTLVRGAVRVVLPVLRKGRYTLSMTYSGSALFTPVTKYFTITQR